MTTAGVTMQVFAWLKKKKTKSEKTHKLTMLWLLTVSMFAWLLPLKLNNAISRTHPGHFCPVLTSAAD